MFHNTLWAHYKATVFTELAKLCAVSGHELKIVHMAQTESARKGLGDAEIGLHDYPYEVLFSGSFQQTNLLARFRAAYRAFKKFKPDVLMIGQYSDFSLLFLSYLAKIKGVRIAIAADATPFDSKRSAFKEFIKSLLLKPFDLFFCYGSMSKKYLESLGVPEQKIKIRYQATQNEETKKLFEIAKANKSSGFSDKNFLYVGRFSKEKNLFFLLDAFSKVENKSWGLIMVGAGPQEEELKEHAESQKIASVFWVGAKDWRGVVSYYAAANVLVLPSLSEPWGLVVNEAMLCELPVLVSSHCGSSADLVRDGENGYIFDPYNEGGLVRLMNKFANEQVDSKSMGQRSFELVQPYSPKKSAEQMLEGLESVL